jgi:thiol-disulfide isomerase/thioredoxin
LHPNDSLKITTSQRIFDVFAYKRENKSHHQSRETSQPPIFKGKAAALNQFLYKNGLHGRDSLREKPLIEHATAEMYATMMDDIADYNWGKYQKQFGLADTAQAVYVQASLAGQSYLRKLRFGSDDVREFGIDLVPFIPSFTIIQNDAAHYSEDYLYALINYLKISFFDNPNTKYNEILSTLKNVPKTSEIIAATFLKDALQGGFRFLNYEETVANFEKDFPKSDYIYQIKRASWSSRSLHIGTQFPAIVFENNNKQNTDITKFKGKATAILFWNTWCDSCQIRLSEFAQLAENYKDSSINFVAIAANNRVDSWQEFIKSGTYPNVTHLYVNADDLEILRGAMTDRNFPTNAHLLLLDSTGRITERLNLSQSVLPIATQIKHKISK